MDSFEEAFDNATRVTDQALKANKDLSKQLHGLRRASQTGNITAVKREQSRLAAALDELTEAVNNVGVAWPFDDEQEVQYLKAADGYAAELRRVASEKGLVIRERDGQMICHPFIVRVIPSDRAVRIDRKKVSTIQAVPLGRRSNQGSKVTPALSAPEFPRGAAQGLSISDERILGASHWRNRRPRYSLGQYLRAFHVAARQL